ncbi:MULTISPECIES: DNA mismatch repair endonuclease MutL [Clostridia]|jgi:DNA mismatch repair protein MutL|uniref:DNA mismatch repair endonuclease MutL n=1 Tax=Clostridia TaxID=186801 RepID=UPI000E4BE7E3|nr:MULTISPECIES: DNA mismatch repair endonuclease MutL [Clostridia]RGH41570.1 DNA mismatch repair endonuclease MutL [Firmicutes bacterium AM41-5BH]RKQ32019.1 DNA mismatch repair endonuclease MutL [Ruminococcus sp. B05]TAP36262.1 DNA mismatch repair endonuclease MutL [Mediterraneibacter sp. gm002]
MQHIQVLDQVTIDKIAAGEVIERPASIVKELVENAIDAGATHVTIEIEEGGISLIRITDDGSGIMKEDIRNAFLRHSTSKIRNVEDLLHITSLGFRGEALSSIAAVTKVEVITKTKEAILGTRYVIEGGQELSLEEAGSSDGTTFIIRQLFYNVPARRKFLKTAMTEAGHVQDLLIRLALSHPEVAFRFLNNNQEKLRTSGSGKLKDVIYNIYGRDVASNLLELDYWQGGIHITGYLGKPLITRGNRNFETFFVNGRYVKSTMISRAVEDAYKDFMMQHKFPFVVLHFQVDTETVDVNVHPTKMELRFQNQQEVYKTVFEAIHRQLLEPELIPQVEVPEPLTSPVQEKKKTPSPDLKLVRRVMPSDSKEAAASITTTPIDSAAPTASEQVKEEPHNEDYFIRKMRERVMSYHNRNSSAEVKDQKKIFRPEEQKKRIQTSVHEATTYKVNETPVIQKPKQLDLFEEKLLKRETRAEYRLIGQIFDTYWLVQFQDNLYIIDQHAAHERVLYERTLKEMKNREFTSQYLSPPIILTLSMQEAELLKTHKERFERIGFEIEPFGGEEYAIRAVPANLFSIAKKELFMEMLDNLADGLSTNMTPDIIDEKVASMSCKAAVKGNNRLSAQEVDALIGELLELENPYHCPHGRPTIIAMSKKELEKKFKRIV